MTSALVANYGHPQLQFARGKGVYLYTAEGERYVDFTMGMASFWNRCRVKVAFARCRWII